MGQETGEAFQKEAVGPIPNERGVGDGAHTPWYLRDQNGATQPCVQHQLLLTPGTPGCPIPPQIAPRDPGHSHDPPSTLLSGCAASVTHLGRVPLVLCLTGFMVLQSSAQMLCALYISPDPRCAWPHSFPCAVSILESGALSSLLDSVQAPNRVHCQHLAHSRCSVNAVNKPVSGFVGQGPQTTSSRMDQQCVTVPFLVSAESCMGSSGPGASQSAFGSAVKFCCLHALIFLQGEFLAY